MDSAVTQSGGNIVILLDIAHDHGGDAAVTEMLTDLDSTPEGEVSMYMLASIKITAHAPITMPDDEAQRLSTAFIDAVRRELGPNQLRREFPQLDIILSD